MEIQRLEKLLQDAGIKLTSVASRTWSKSALAMVEALIAGERDPERLAELSKSRMRAKKDRLAEAMAGRFAAHHGVVARQILDHIAFLDSSIARLTTDIAERIRPFEPAIELLCGIPGWGRATAEVFIAETGGDMSVFPSSGQLAAWSERHRVAMSRPASVGPWVPITATAGSDGPSSRQLEPADEPRRRISARNTAG